MEERSVKRNFVWIDWCKLKLFFEPLIIGLLVKSFCREFSMKCPADKTFLFPWQPRRGGSRPHFRPRGSKKKGGECWRPPLSSASQRFIAWQSRAMNQSSLPLTRSDGILPWYIKVGRGRQVNLILILPPSSGWVSRFGLFLWNGASSTPVRF